MCLCDSRRSLRLQATNKELLLPRRLPRFCPSCKQHQYLRPVSSLRTPSLSNHILEALGPSQSCQASQHSVPRISGLVFALCACGLLLDGCASTPAHGTITSMSVAKQHDWQACQHSVPEEVCVQCRPERAARFKQKGDWCPEHDVPESQCLKCHPDLDFSPPATPPATADVVQLVGDGGDLLALEPHRVANKITVFDFHAEMVLLGGRMHCC